MSSEQSTIIGNATLRYSFAKTHFVPRTRNVNATLTAKGGFLTVVSEVIIPVNPLLD